ncbi:AsmA family protein [Parahaliea mediterranea]|uniref:AsmA family protein n=1 Tax=Parahaliea mediterranea TaxID=651086 RepID=A0A939DG90_9GAMM|nr:AsmA family protein [Parahaliea mediterranea]MBN7796947.1 AsmA family protein [Parahaliea mediterranea]
MPRTILNTAAILAGLVLALLITAIAGLLLYLQYGDLNTQRPRLESLVSQATGRPFRIEGELELKLWPELFLSVGGLQLANAEWASGEPMARLGQFAVKIRPGSLLLGPLDIRELHLRDLDLLVETGPTGETNWALATPDPEEAPDPPSRDSGNGDLAVILQRAQLSNLRLRYPGPDSETQSAMIRDLSLVNTDADRLRVEGRGTALDMPLTVSGQVDTRDGVVQTDAVRYELALVLGESRLAVEGTRTPPASDSPARMSLDLRMDGLQPLMDRLAVPLTVPGPLQLAVHGRGEAQRADIDIEGRLGAITLDSEARRSGDSLAIDGSISTLAQAGALFDIQGLPAAPLTWSSTLILEKNALDIREFSATTGQSRITATGHLGDSNGGSSLSLEANAAAAAELLDTLPPLPFTVAATLALREGELSIAPLEARLGDSDLTGTVRIGRGERGSVDIQLQSRRIDLSQLSAHDKTRPDTGGKAPEEAPDTAAGESSAPRYVFTGKPLPFSMLQKNTADFHWAIDELATPLVTLAAMDLSAGLHAGRLEAQAAFEGPAGGLGRNSLVLETSGNRAELTLQNRLRDLRINVASGNVERVNDIPALNLTLDLAASGSSPRELAAASDGKLLLTLGPGQLNNSVVEKFSGDLLAQLVSALDPFARTQTHMAFECGVAAATIEGGEALLDPLAFQSEKLQVIAGGSIDLKTEAIDIEFNTRPRSGVGVSADMFVTPFVSLKGTLSKPRVGMNESSTLLTGGAAVATGGLSLLWKGLYDRAAGSIDHCRDTLEKHAHPPLDGK